ncbi:hypothetical protein LJC27_06680 [Christensenellaceae bacterium OttesenSCG-928-M15]|nr:hypothetical protein [Christensenellaceae bacterium OttesenSCG-928-M15]
MTTKKILITCVIFLLILTLIFLSLYLRERRTSELNDIAFLTIVHSYLYPQLLEWPDDLTEDEWVGKLGFLQIAGNYLARGATKYGDYGKVSEAILLFREVPYENYKAALDFMRSLRISYNTYDSPPQVDVAEGDIDAIIQGLKTLQAEGFLE